MGLSYGNYTHDEQECRVGITKVARLSAAGVLVETRETWTIEGILIASGDTAAELTQDLTDQIADLETAYKQRNVDLTLTLNGVIHDRIRNSDTIGGIRVVGPPSFPEGRGAQGGTHRTYMITLEADIKPTTGPGASDTFIVEWEETLEMFGGGPLLQFTAPLAGFPVKTVVASNTPYFAVQSGLCVMRGRYFEPTPIFGTGLLMERGRVAKVSPVYRGGTGPTVYRDYRTTWSYLFGSQSPLISEPNKQPPQ